jgi:hypothetical protein
MDAAFTQLRILLMAAFELELAAARCRPAVNCTLGFFHSVEILDFGTNARTDYASNGQPASSSLFPRQDLFFPSINLQRSSCTWNF